MPWIAAITGGILVFLGYAGFDRFYLEWICLVPVLWAPLAGVQYPPELREALDSSVTERDYADNGLRALLKLKSYHDLYQVVVDRMGAQIVEIAERDPIEPVEPEVVGDIENAPSAFLGLLAGRNFGKLVVRVSADA